MRRVIDSGSKSDRSRRPILLMLGIATAIASLGNAAGGTAGALLGVQFIGSAAGAGLPIGLLVVGQAAAALLISQRTDRLGRSQSLAFGYVLGVIGAALVIFAVVAEYLVALMVGSTVLGAGNAAIFLTRYAAAELVAETNRGRALGAVLFATAFGGIASPGLVGPSGDLATFIGLPSLTGLYLVAIVCFALAALLLNAVSQLAPLGGGAALLGPVASPRASRRALSSSLSDPSARAALIILAATNLMMVAVMAIAPVHLTAHGHSLDRVGFIVGIHVAGMFLPSPISGWAADRLGPVHVASAGISLLVAVGIAGTIVDQESGLWMAGLLATLGIGWNFGVVGGSKLLADAVPADQRPRVEGLGEVSMGLAAGAGAMIAGPIVLLGGLTALFLSGSFVVATVVLALAVIRRVR